MWGWPRPALPLRSARLSLAPSALLKCWTAEPRPFGSKPNSLQLNIFYSSPGGWEAQLLFVVHQGLILLLFPVFSPLAACAPVTYTRIQSVPSFLTYLKLRERIFPEFSGRPNSSLSNWESFWDRPVLITRHCLKLLYDLMVFILSNRSAESGQS